MSDLILHHFDASPYAEEPGAALAMTVNEGLPGDLLHDRREFFTHMDFTALATRVPQLYAQPLRSVRRRRSRLRAARSRRRAAAWIRSTGWDCRPGRG